MSAFGPKAGIQLSAINVPFEVEGDMAAFAKKRALIVR